MREAGTAGEIPAQALHHLLGNVDRLVVQGDGIDWDAAVAVPWIQQHQVSGPQIEDARPARHSARAGGQAADDIVFVEVGGEGLNDPLELVGLQAQIRIVACFPVFSVHDLRTFLR